jgi:hypothetical protein
MLMVRTAAAAVMMMTTTLMKMEKKSLMTNKYSFVLKIVLGPA